MSDSHGSGITRRGILKGTTLSVALSPLIAPTASAWNEPVWLEARRHFSFTQPPRFMNVGNAGSMPTAAQYTQQRETQICAASFINGYDLFPEERQKVASAFGCSSDEIAFTNSTSDSCFRALFGLTWEASDEIITTDQEHSGCTTPMNVLAQKLGIVVKTVTIPSDPNITMERIVTLFEAAITQKSKVIVFSSPTFAKGIMLPIRAIASLAQRYELTTICDASHLPGMFPINARAMGVDFLAGAGHKWQCGPLGTGFLYIRNRVTPEFNNLPLPQFEAVSWYGPIPDRNTPEGRSIDIASRVIALGSRNRPAYVALTKACELWDRFGRDRIADQVRANAEQLRTAIVRHWGVNALYSPLTDTRLHSGMISFNPLIRKMPAMDMNTAATFASNVKQLSGHTVGDVNFNYRGQFAWATRIGPHFWHGPEDIDQVVRSMWQVTNKMLA